MASMQMESDVEADVDWDVEWEVESPPDVESTELVESGADDRRFDARTHPVNHDRAIDAPGPWPVLDDEPTADGLDDLYPSLPPRAVEPISQPSRATTASAVLPHRPTGPNHRCPPRAPDRSQTWNMPVQGAHGLDANLQWPVDEMRDCWPELPAAPAERLDPPALLLRAAARRARLDDEQRGRRWNA